MKILFAHCRYQQTGGEDRVVEAETAALRQAGHDVSILERDNDAISTTWDKAKTAWSLPGTDAVRSEIRAEIAAHAPDIIHAHNIFPLITPSLYDAARDLGLPVVQTLHNYRNICASALLMRDGQICEDCIGASPYQAVLHRCYRGSIPGSFALARMIALHREKSTWSQSVDHFIALSEFSKSRFVAAGFPAGKIAVKPNSPSALFAEKPEAQERSGALYVGRLSPEKGIAALLRLWKRDWPPLRVVGDGPDATALNEAVRDGRAVALGPLESQAIAIEMRRAALCIVPSRCYENFPMVIAEAFACALPVLASNIGALGELVQEDRTGARFDPFDPNSITRTIDAAFADPDKLARWGATAREHFEKHLTSAETTAQQTSIYEGLLTGERASA
ncbi:glycosyltransferase family 4 protein [Nisaea sp.]|uniref:glycosyltransferase family 4 protein n=1 Tax=Nisaea sp. TaxID=2024842 RepID=UPI003298CD59